jgi:PDZ domain-containing protein
VPAVGLGTALAAVIGVASLLPSELVADELNERVDEVQGTPYARTPAAAQSVKDRLVFDEIEAKAKIFPAAGDVYFVTVAEPRQSLLGYLVGEGRADVEWLTREEKFGTQTPTQRREISLQMMRTAEEVAQYVAFTKVGYEAELVDGAVVVQQLACLEQSDTECTRWAPARDAIEPGDTLLAVDGVDIPTVDDLSAVLAGKQPGDVVEVRLTRPEVGDLLVEVELVQSTADPDRTIIGFVPFDTRSVDLPFEVDFKTGGIGGPSAGLAFTLSLIDELTEGDLMGGRTVAVTGTIDFDGNVGAIGGLPQKASAVRQAGVDVFIVPAAQGDDEVAQAIEAGEGEVEIIEVATLDEALAALERLGGEPLVPIT